MRARLPRPLIIAPRLIFKTFRAVSRGGGGVLYCRATMSHPLSVTDPALAPVREKVLAGEPLSHADGVALYASRDLHAIGRLANFVNVELWGRISDVPWAMVFPHPDAGPLPRHPSQLYEALTEGLVLFAVLWWLTHRRQALRTPGVIGGAFLVGYGLARSFCEFFREPDAGHILTVGPFTAGIFYSLPMVLVGFLAIRAAGKRSSAPANVQS